MMDPDDFAPVDDGDPDDAFDADDQPLVLDDTVHDLVAAMERVTDLDSALTFYDQMAGH